MIRHLLRVLGLGLRCAGEGLDVPRRYSVPQALVELGACERCGSDVAG